MDFKTYLLFLAFLIQDASGDLRFRQWWKAIRNTPSCIPYVRQYSWTWLPSKNSACENGRQCNFPKEICMSYTERPSDLKCQRVPSECYSDASLFFCPGRHQEFQECGSKCPKSCAKPRQTCQDECTPGCYCKDPWTLVRTERSVCVRRDHCHYFVDAPGTVPSWDPEPSSPLLPAQKKKSQDDKTLDLHIQTDMMDTGFSQRSLATESEQGTWGQQQKQQNPDSNRWRKQSRATSVPLMQQAPDLMTTMTPEVDNGNPPDACIRDQTKYPLGAEHIARDVEAAGIEWPYSVVHVCVEGIGGRARSTARWSPVACLDNRNRRVEIGQTFLDESKDFLMRCDNSAAVGLSLRTISCVYQNDTFFPNGSAWTVANIVQKCHLTERGPGSRIAKSGCVDDFGKSVEDGEEFRSKDGLHYRKCVRGQDDIWRVLIVACIDSTGGRRRCDQDYSIYARLKLAGYAKKLCRLCNTYVSELD